jgi:hypothetical protein
MVLVDLINSLEEQMEYEKENFTVRKHIFESGDREVQIIVEQDKSRGVPDIRSVRMIIRPSIIPCIHITSLPALSSTAWPSSGGMRLECPKKPLGSPRSDSI